MIAINMNSSTQLDELWNNRLDYIGGTPLSDLALKRINLAYSAEDRNLNCLASAIIVSEALGSFERSEAEERVIWAICNRCAISPLVLLVSLEATQFIDFTHHGQDAPKLRSALNDLMRQISQNTKMCVHGELATMLLQRL